MEKYVLKVNGNCKSVEDVVNMSLALKSNIGLKISKGTARTDDAKFVHNRKSLVRNEKLLEILNSQTFQPLFIDTSPVIGTSSNICDDENVQPPQSNNEGTPNRCLDRNLMETFTSTPIDSQLSAMNVNVGTPKNHHMLARLQRDLDSPSAAIRLRAIRALKSPAHGPYNQFDIPHEEQDIITPEERQDLIPKTIQDVMKDVVVYVEMRCGDENRTAGIKGVIGELGATVNDNFNRNTTHIIFKDGMQSTYNKAKNWNIPIVSILWIEACKKQLRIVDPSKYPITNIERYENPELYKKVKVKKFFQPEFKIKKPKKITPTLEKFNTIQIPKKAKDNLTGILNDFRDRLVNNSDGIDYFSDNSKLANLLSDSKSQINSAKNPPHSDVMVSPSLRKNNLTSVSQSNRTKIGSAKKALPSLNAKSIPNDNSPKRVDKIPTNRKILFTPTPTVNSLVRVTRRSSLLALPSPSIQNTSFPRTRDVMPAEITELYNKDVNQTKNNSEGMEITLDAATISNNQSTPKVISNRQTLLTTSEMDITNPQPILTSTRKRLSLLPSKLRDYEVNTNKYLVKSSKTTSNTSNSLSRKNNQSRSLFPPSLLIGSTLNNMDKTRNLNNVDKTSQSVSKPHHTSFTLSDTSSLLAVAGLNNDEMQRGSSHRRRTISRARHQSTDVSPPKNAVETPKLLSKDRRTCSTVPSQSIKAALSVKDNNSSALIRPDQINSNQLNASIQDNLFNGSNGSVTVQTPNSSKGHVLSKHLPYNNLTPKNCTLLEEYSQRLTFSSTNKRKTMHDVSMHIIEQRLKNINENARLNRSVSESDVNTNVIDKNLKLTQSSPHLIAIDNNGSKRKQLDNDYEIPLSKKRRLFDRIAYEEQVAMINSESNLDRRKKPAKSLNSPNASNVRKKNSSTTHCNKQLKQRLSLLDFQTEPMKPGKIYAAAVKPSSSNNYVAYTNMSQDQIKVLTEAVTTLGKFTIESNVTKRTTHLVSFETKRTQKFLRAIIRGLWIVDFNWVSASLSAGVWLYEEPFENRALSIAVSMCRAEAQAFGPNYKIDIFGHLDPIYISTKCKCPGLKVLYKMCGGRVTNSKSTAKYIVADKLKDKVCRLCLHSNWILNSIQLAACENPLKYVLKYVAPNV